MTFTSILLLVSISIPTPILSSHVESPEQANNNFRSVNYPLAILPLNPLTMLNVTNPSNATSIVTGNKLDVMWSAPNAVKAVDIKLLCLKDNVAMEVEVKEIDASTSLVGADDTQQGVSIHTFAYKISELPPALSCGYGNYYFLGVYESTDEKRGGRDFGAHTFGYSPFPRGFFTILAAAANYWWLFGVFLSIIASISSNLGVNLQKLSMMRERANAKASEKRGYFTQPLWLTGLLMVIVGSLGDFVALGFAPQSLMTPVGGFTLVCNAVFAHYFLDEHLTTKDRIGTLNIIIGIIVLAVFSSKDSTSYTLKQLLKMFTQRGFVIYVLVLIVIIANLYRWYLKCIAIEAKWGR